MKKIISLLIILCTCFIVFSQVPSAKIYGVVTDAETGEPLPFANVILEKDSVQITGTSTDFDGIYLIKPIASGEYTVKINYVGYTPKQIHGIKLVNGQSKKVDISLMASAVQMEDYMVQCYKSPLIKRSNTKRRHRADADVARHTAGVYAADDASGYLNIRGARLDANYYYIDGMKVMGNPKAVVSQEDFENMAVRVVNDVSSSGEYSTYYSRFVAESMLTATQIQERQNSSQYEYQEPFYPQGSSTFTPIYENDFENVNRAPLSTFSADVDHAGYSVMRNYVSNGHRPPVDAVRLEELVNYFDYNYPSPEGKHPFSVYTEYTVCPWNPQNLLVHVGVKARELAWDTVPPNNLVFLLDVSGSMSASNKLGLVKRGLRMLVDQLRPQDRVSMVVYAGASGVVLKPTKGDNKKAILNALNKLEAGGSTAGAAGIALAYQLAEKHFDKNGNNRIILATDGDFNVGTSNVNELEKLIATKRQTGVYLTVMGFGSGNLQDDIMETLADKGNGNYYYIDDVLEAKRVMVEGITGSFIAVAKDVKFQVEFNPMQVAEYRLLGYENRLLDDEDFADDTKDAGEVGAGQTVTLLYEIVPQSPTENRVYQDLRYQNSFVSKDTLNNELLMVKCRYKQPESDTSILMQQPLVFMEHMKKPSEAMLFSASIIEFGLLLRNSAHKNNANFKQAIALAKEGKGVDEQGYRAECIKLMQKAELILKEDKAQLAE